MAMTLRLNQGQEEKLAALAEQMKTSRTSVVKQALEEKYERERHRFRVSEAAEFFQTRDRDILRRLAE